MIIIHDMNGFPYPRLALSSLRERLDAMPAVVVTGARQAGKSTLVRDLAGGQRRYWNLDDWEVLDLARSSPDALVQGTQPVTIDEIQREPDLLVAVKREIDRRRDPGRFLLTGSSDLLLMRNVSESLAGRSSYLTLWPMTRRERLGMGACGIWDHLLRNRDADWEDVITGHSVPRDDWRLLAMRGGFPTPSIHMQTAKEREVWFEGYVRAYVERDLRQLSAIAALPDFRRLMRAICLRIGQLVNQTKLGRDAGLAQPTVHRWLNLLETSYLLVRVPAYAANRTKRLIKSPKFYWSDTGLAMHIAREPEPRGAHLENLVLSDLLAWRDIRLDRAGIFHWRTVGGEEVDFIIETADGLLPIEVKATTRPRLGDTSNLRLFRQEYGAQARSGLLLHAGDRVAWITPEVLAVPWWCVL